MINYPVDLLLDLAEGMRGPDWRDELQNALLAAKHFGGWTEADAWRYAFSLLLTDGSSPRELGDKARSPLQHEGGTEPPAEYREIVNAALARLPRADAEAGQ